MPLIELQSYLILLNAPFLSLVLGSSDQISGRGAQINADFMCRCATALKVIQFVYS